MPPVEIGSAGKHSFVDVDLLRVRSDRRLVCTLLTFLLVPLLWSTGLDAVVYAGDLPLLRARLIVHLLGILVSLGGLLLVRAAQTRKAYSRAVLAVSMTMTLNLVNQLLRPYGSLLPMRSALLLLIVMYGAMPNSFARQIVPPLVYTAGIIGERALWLTSNAAGDLATDVLILLFVNAIGLVMVHRRLALEREIGVRIQAEQLSLLTAKRALEDLGTLRGIIPICSHCRKVRTEVGDWLQLEHYLEEHTDAGFSPGVCPACRRTHHQARQSIHG